MDRYRYFIFNQKSMVLLGLLQIACATVCIIGGLIDGAFRRDSALSKSRVPIWAGVFMAIPGIMALFSSMRKNPVLVNAMIIASVFSCFVTLLVIIYTSITLEYGEKYEEFDDVSSYHHPAVAFVLGKLVEGANITLLIASLFSAFIVLIIAYLSCRSLPCCSCYDSVTGLERLESNEDQLQIAELVCIPSGQVDTIFNSPVKLSDLDMEADDDMPKPPPYIRMT
ncbi:uncharacterized protein LOC128421083 [Podarcis raffonei]|uniref:uncharacterized protein LOC128421083 n=1 Tax=Podarcis raffonei TaxID=65483 RepID=UPI00232921E6|nr:uncharacterized protein LOC128421083 [Podarcis raffonei]XP_053259310.1 uncharacterized protein LOC128421083 [Podarcis raffonei]XP_053259311.1 uncharacterized protein LOC128421083 [Podarcis raffonei]